MKSCRQNSHVDKIETLTFCLGLAFRNLVDDSALGLINSSCVFDSKLKVSNWKWTYFGNLISGLPVCSSFCPGKKNASKFRYLLSLTELLVITKKWQGFPDIFIPDMILLCVPGIVAYTKWRTCASKHKHAPANTNAHPIMHVWSWS